MVINFYYIVDSRSLIVLTLGPHKKVLNHQNGNHRECMQHLNYSDETIPMLYTSGIDDFQYLPVLDLIMIVKNLVFH